MRRALLVVAGLRIGLGIIGWITAGPSPSWVVWQGFPAPTTTGPEGALTSPWLRDDAIHYRAIAAHGYLDAAEYSFFPLYPMLARIAGATGIGVIAGCLLVSTVAAVAALVLLDRLTRLEAGDRSPRGTVLLTAFFPYAFFLIAPFTESLFLALSLGSFLAMRRGRLGTAGVLGALAALTRFQGVLLALPLGIELWQRWRRDPRRRVAPGAVLAVLLPVSANLGFLLYGRLHGGLALGYMTATASIWGTHTAMPWTVILDSVRSIPAEHPEELGNLIAIGLAIATLPLMVRRLPLSYAAYTAAMLATSLLHENRYSPLMSAGRFVTVLFPVFMVLALWLGRRRLIPMVLAFGLIMAVLFTRMVGYHFVG